MKGKKVYVSEVVADNVRFLESGGQGQSSQGSGGQQQQQAYGSGSSQRTGYNDQNRFNDDPFANDGKPIDISDDDLPF